MKALFNSIINYPYKFWTSVVAITVLYALGYFTAIAAFAIAANIVVGLLFIWGFVIILLTMYRSLISPESDIMDRSLGAFGLIVIIAMIVGIIRILLL